MYALANNPNRLETTARKAHRPTFGADEVKSSWLAGNTPLSTHGFSFRRWISSHHTVMARSKATDITFSMARSSA